MRYEGPIYRPPSEADSLLIQATIGCPHNNCTFCMVYKSGPRYKVRDVKDIKADILKARDICRDHVNLEGKLPEEKKRLLDKIGIALKQDETSFRPFFIGTE
jgi:radical SAM superfamily enzyme YgiQ (UPF0313 family)